MRTRKSWREKMDNPKLPKVVPVPPRMQKRFGTGAMLIPAPREMDALIRTIPAGGLITLTRIREELARSHGADTTCPLVTGILVRIVTEAAEEAAAGAEPVTPYWRVVTDDGSLNPKFPGGVERQGQRLRAEGHRIATGRGKRPPRVVF